MLQHDWISIEPEISTGVLSITDGQVTIGIVKEVGSGYYSEYGNFITTKGINLGDKILFNQHLTLEVNGEKVYRVRARDVIEVLNASV